MNTPAGKHSRKKPKPPADLFDTARLGDVLATQAFLDAGADPAALNSYGFNALHCAAMGANSADNEAIVQIMKTLIAAGAPLEAVGGGGRTALFLAAEFSCSVGPVKALLEAGADPLVRNSAGRTSIENALVPEVQKLLSAVTGIPIPDTPPPPPMEVKLSAREWKDVKKRLDKVFEELQSVGIVSVQDAGYTQEDGFSDGSAKFTELGGEPSGFHGFCFYTRQDLNRAKRTSHLWLVFWGAPEGGDRDMLRVGQQVVDMFQKSGFQVDWNGKSSARPMVILKSDINPAG